jgi:hypothetical protein
MINCVKTKVTGRSIALSEGPSGLPFYLILIALALLSIFPSPASAGDERLTIRESPFNKGEYDVLEKGRRVGTVRENPFHSGELELRDRQGRREATIEKSPFRDGELTVRENGRHTGTIRPDPFRKGEYRLEDRAGAQRGQIRRSPFAEKQWKLLPEKR